MSGILKCGWCQRQFVKSRDGARFCCTACHDRYHIDERRKALAAYRQMQGASLFSMAYNLAWMKVMKTTIENGGEHD